MAVNWVQVEDDPYIIDSELDESIYILENVTFFTVFWLIMNIILTT